MITNTLYNEKQKLEFLNDKFQQDAHNYNTILSMFEQMANDEYAAETDLCDMHPKQIALLLIQYARYNKFSSFRSRYGFLLLYREYCIEHNYINPIKFYGSLNRFGERISDRELYDLFDDHRKNYRKYFYHPKELYEYLAYEIYDIKEVNLPAGINFDNYLSDMYTQEDILETEESRIAHSISSDELVVLYLCLIYYGVPKQHCCNIKIRDIIIDEKEEKIIIRLNHEYYKIDIFMLNLFQKVMSARYICRNRNMTQTFIPKDPSYLLCYAEDTTLIERTKRNKKLSDKYYKDAERQGKDVISVKEIIDQGVVYRMCVLSYDKHLHPKTLQDHIDLYKAVGGDISINIKSVRAVELRKTYTDHFNELYMRN